MYSFEHDSQITKIRKDSLIKIFKYTRNICIKIELKNKLEDLEKKVSS